MGLGLAAGTVAWHLPHHLAQHPCCTCTTHPNPAPSPGPKDAHSAPWPLGLPPCTTRPTWALLYAAGTGASSTPLERCRAVFRAYPPELLALLDRSTADPRAVTEHAFCTHDTEAMTGVSSQQGLPAALSRAAHPCPRRRA